VFRTETERNERTGVGGKLRLPALVGLIFLHGGFCLSIPLAAGRAGHIFLVDEGGLNLASAVWIDATLALHDVVSGAFSKGLVVVAS
jgi:hypothetical protein